MPAALNCVLIKNDFLFYRLKNKTDGRRGRGGRETDKTVSRARDGRSCNPGFTNTMLSVELVSRMVVPTIHIQRSGLDAKKIIIEPSSNSLSTILCSSISNICVFVVGGVLSTCLRRDLEVVGLFDSRSCVDISFK